MKTKFVILGLIFFIVACGTPIIQETQLYPKEADFLYSQMLLTLQELGWTIKHTDKSSMTIMAQTVSTGSKFVDSMGGADLPYQVSAVFEQNNGETSLSLTVTQPGEMMQSTSWAKKWKERIMEKFNEKIK